MPAEPQADGPAPTASDGPADSAKRPLPNEDNTLSPSSKRSRVDTAQHDSTTGTARSYHQSSQFWYPDGNVIVIVGHTGFKLYRARLATYCEYFAARAPAAAAEGEGEGENPSASGPGDRDVDADQPGSDDTRSDDQPAPPTLTYDVDGLSSSDFARFLSALETPLKYALEEPNQSTAVSLLRAGTRLGCSAVVTMARHTLLKLWKNTAPTPTDPLRPVDDAIEAITVSREFNMPELRKRAFYELLRSPAFWAQLSADRTKIALPDADLLKLHHARHEMQCRWRALVLVPPYTGKEGSRCAFVPTPKPKTCKYTMDELRVASWRSHVIDSKEWETGAVDPIGGIQSLKDSVEGWKHTWCARCLNERRSEWNRAKAQWWALLDDLSKPG